MLEIKVTIPRNLLLNSTDACCTSINLGQAPVKGDPNSGCPVIAALCAHNCDTCALMAAVRAALNIAEGRFDG